MKFTDMTDLNRQGPRIERTSLNRGERNIWFVDSAHQATVLSVAERTLRPLATVPRDLGDLSLSSDGRLFATSEYNGSIRLRRRADGSTVSEWLRVHQYAPKLAFSPDSRRLLSVGGAALWWDLNGEAPAVTLKVEALPSGATFGPDGRYLITIEGSAAILREGRRGAPVARMPSRPGFAVTSARFSPDGQIIVTTSVDRMIRLWRTGSSTPLRELPGHTDAVLDAWFSADGQSIVSVAQDRTARVWDVATGHSIAELRGSSDNWDSASFHPTGELVLTGGGHNAAAMWDARTGALLISFTGSAAFTGAVGIS